MKEASIFYKHTPLENTGSKSQPVGELFCDVVRQTVATQFYWFVMSSPKKHFPSMKSSGNFHIGRQK